MKTIYLPIRAFGDFIITASIVKNNFKAKIPMVLPDYLAEIFHAINGGEYFEVIDKIHYNNQPAFFELYKVKDLKNLKRLISDIRILSSFVNKQDEYLMDYSCKRLSYTNANFIWQPTEGNIYEQKLCFLAAKNLINPNHHSIKIKPVSPGKMLRILILPDSRIHLKSIGNELLELMIKNLYATDIRIGHFSKKKDLNNGCLYYSDFNELIDLISSYELVISAESLPYHLANYLNKPHFVIYNQTRHFKLAFMTPFMVQNKYYSIFTGSNANEVIAEINNIIYTH